MKSQRSFKLFTGGTLRWFLILGFLIALCANPAAGQRVEEPPTEKYPDWSASYPAFRIAGDLYYVGTRDLACYLVTSSKGHILINTGLSSSASQIEASIESLGFHLADVKILLTTQAHYDHLGAMTAIKLKSGAKFWVNAPDSSVAADGGMSDYEMAGVRPLFAPVHVDSVLKDGATIKLGNNKLVLISHPGHTKGSCSYLLSTSDSSAKYTVLIANLPSIITDKKFNEVSTYPTIASDYAATFKSLKKLKFDLWVASHASQFDLHEKHKPGDPYKPMVFADKAGFMKAVTALEKRYQQKLKQQ